MRGCFVTLIVVLLVAGFGCSGKEDLIFNNRVDPDSPTYSGYIVTSPSDFINLPSVSITNVPTKLLLNMRYTFTAEATDENPGLLPDRQPGEIVKYVWHFGGGAIIVGETNTVSYTFSEETSYQVISLTVTDNDNNARTFTTTVEVVNTIPSAMAGGPYSGASNSPITLSGTARDKDSEGRISQYFWDFDGDNLIDWSSDTTGVASHLYETPGTYFPVFSARDNSGAMSQKSATVVYVYDDRPIASAGGPYTTKINTWTTFSGTADDSAGYLSHYEWDFTGDGIFDFASNGLLESQHHYVCPAHHNYANAGVFTAVLRVTDNTGNQDLDSTTVVVTNHHPVAETTGPYTFNVNTRVTLEGTGNDPDGSIVFYQWDYDGDGIYDWSSPDNGIATLTYETPGSYAARFRVVDDDGNSVVVVVPVTVYASPDYSETYYVRTLNEYDSDVRSVAFSPDGQYLAVGTFDNRVDVWQVSDWSRINSYSHDNVSYSNAVTSVRFIPGTHLLASAAYDSTIKIWDYRISSASPVHELTAHNDAVSCLAVSSDGEYLLSGGYNGYVTLWDTGTWQAVHQMNAFTATPPVYSVAFTTDNQRVICSGADEDICVYSVQNLTFQKRIPCNVFAVTAVAAHPDGERILAGGVNGLIQILHIETGEELGRLVGHSSQIGGLAVTESGLYAVSGSYSKSTNFRIWNLTTETTEKAIESYPASIRSVAISPDGTLIATCGQGHVAIWEAE